MNGIVIITVCSLLIPKQFHQQRFIRDSSEKEIKDCATYAMKDPLALKTCLSKLCWSLALSLINVEEEKLITFTDGHALQARKFCKKYYFYFLLYLLLLCFVCYSADNYSLPISINNIKKQNKNLKCSFPCVHYCSWVMFIHARSNLIFCDIII